MLFLVAKSKDNLSVWNVYNFQDSEEIPEGLTWDKMFASRKRALIRIKELKEKEGKE